MPQSVEGHDLASYSLPKKHYQSHNPTHGPELRKIIQNYSFQLNDKIGRGYSSTVFRGTNDLTRIFSNT